MDTSYLNSAYFDPYIHVRVIQYISFEASVILPRLPQQVGPRLFCMLRANERYRIRSTMTASASFLSFFCPECPRRAKQSKVRVRICGQIRCCRPMTVLEKRTLQFLVFWDSMQCSAALRSVAPICRPKIFKQRQTTVIRSRLKRYA